MVGGYIGSSFDTYHTPGPRLGDLALQTSQEGAPRPIVYGTPQPFSGNLMQSGEPIRIVVEEDTGGGKGGPSYTTDRERAFQTFAIRICEGNENLKLLRFWVEGKLAYSAFGEGLEADSITTQSKFTFHPGGEDEMPDPVLEALPVANGGGVGNTIAYRGTCYIVFDNFEITNFGRIPQFSWQVSTSATVTESCTEGLLAWWPLDDASPNGSARELIQGLDGTYGNLLGTCTVEARASLNHTGFGGTHFGVNDFMTAVDGVDALNREPTEHWSVCVWYRIDEDHNHQNAILGVGYTDNLSGRHAWGNHLGNYEGTGNYLTPAGGYDNGSNHFAIEDGEIGTGTIHYQVTTFDGTAIRLYRNGVLRSTLATTSAGGTVALVNVGGSFTGNPMTAQDLQFWGRALSATEIVNQYLTGPTFFQIPDAPGVYMKPDGTILSPCASSATTSQISLASILTDVASRSKVTSAELDVVEAEDIMVDGYLANSRNEITGQDTLVPLCVSYFGDLPEFDGQIHWTPRGQSIAATFTDDDFLEDDGQQRDGDEVSLGQGIERPRKLKIAYADKDTNYVRRVQMAERESINIPSSGEKELELPLVFDADQAAQKAEIILKVTTEESLGALKRRLPFYKWAHLVPTDRFAYDGKEWRITKLEVQDSELLIEAVRDRISNYTSAAVGGVALDPTAPVSSVKGPSVLQALNLPRLTTAEQEPGMYLGVTGLTNAWPGADVYVSVDGGTTYQKRLTITKRATMGYVVEDVAASTEPVTVYAYNKRTLSSVSVDQIAVGANGIAITTDGVSEIKQFQTAAETDTDNVWELTDVTHGKLETDDVEHFADDLWLLLDDALVFLPIDISHAGKTIYFRAVTRGTPVENNDVVTAVFDPQFTTPAPTDFYTNASGEKYFNADGVFYYKD